jgi:hypothetical protein
MITHMRTRFAFCFAILSLAWLADAPPASSQILSQINDGSMLSPPSDVRMPAPELFRRLPDVEVGVARSGDWPRYVDVDHRGAWSGDQPQTIASYADVAAPASLTSDADWIASAIQPASFSEFGDYGGYKEDGFTLGSVTVVPYGILWSDMSYRTSRTFPGRFILWVQSEEVQGEGAFQVEARYTRLGVDVKGPTLDLFGGITGGGRVEIDFLGAFTVENQPDARLRHAYWEAKNDHVRFLIGQYWDLVSPRLPNTVNFSVSWGAGNIGFRRTQFRLERFFHVSPNMIWTVQGALAQNVIQDFTGGALAAGVRRETGSWPMFQARTAISCGPSCREPVTIGVSGHVGETGFDFLQGFAANPDLDPLDDARFRSWSLNLDYKVPITDCLGVHGEFFYGSNLSPLLGGIVQGVCPCLRVPIRSHGAWFEMWYNVTPNVHAHVGYGFDDPNDNDSLIGRTYNRVAYANVYLDLTEHLITGLEVSSWHTTYHNRTNEPGFVPTDDPTADGEAVAIDWTVRYKF